MTPQAVRTIAANDDLRGIARQIGNDSGRPILAERIIDEIIDCCDYLAELSTKSKLGTAKPRLGAGVRLFSHKRWVIIFRYAEPGVLILRIADGGQDYLSWKLE